ncbi:MAG: CDP-diacylglycerol--serine O-phosphatidyltransferase, partial [Pseudomonadales bacterium]|nr:CDP-diacylglycerol--serine O-phosphatidyltransferase [Pseudomonadales bacterium]
MDNDEKPTLQIVSEDKDEPQDSNDTAKGGQRGLGRRGVYLLPNLITTGSLFAGFYAIVTSMNGQ